MTRSRTAQAVAGLLLLTVMFGSACGGDDDDSGSESPGPAPTEPAAPPPPVTEIVAGPDLDPCILLDQGAEALGLPAEPTDVQTNPTEGKLCTWKEGARTVVVSLFNGNVDQAAEGLGVISVAPAAIAGQQGRQYAEATGCVLLFAVSGNRALVVVASDPPNDNCALSSSVAEAAIPEIA